MGKNATALIPSLWLEYACSACSACKMVTIPPHGCWAARILAADGEFEEQKEGLKDTGYIPLNIF